ncbi:MULTISPECIES: hypothetical protein [Paenibacillus]|uniref:hypothetical protein n=1 Tax=Paenibacillus TaxID=44249 RepID=UPI00096D2553|nr:hypothetical protein [Paenibacillus odorifer]OME34926.1 hypothetical protein BSK58_24790 [Paenibacillus odorifer]
MKCQNCYKDNAVADFRKGAERLVLCVDCRFKLLTPHVQVPESRWSNSACLGYVILGVQRLGYSQSKIKELVSSIYSETGHSNINATVIYELSPYKGELSFMNPQHCEHSKQQYVHYSLFCSYCKQSGLDQYLKD